MYTTIRNELSHARKAWPGTPVDPYVLYGLNSPMGSIPASSDTGLNLRGAADEALLNTVWKNPGQNGCKIKIVHKITTIGLPHTLNMELDL
jgi:hypothetical protein